MAQALVMALVVAVDVAGAVALAFATGVGMMGMDAAVGVALAVGLAAIRPFEKKQRDHPQRLGGWATTLGGRDRRSAFIPALETLSRPASPLQAATRRCHGGGRAGPGARRCAAPLKGERREASRG